MRSTAFGPRWGYVKFDLLLAGINGTPAIENILLKLRFDVVAPVLVSKPQYADTAGVAAEPSVAQPRFKPCDTDPSADHRTEYSERASLGRARRDIMGIKGKIMYEWRFVFLHFWMRVFIGCYSPF